MKQETKEKLKDIFFYILVIVVVFVFCSFISNIVNDYFKMPGQIDQEYFQGSK